MKKDKFNFIISLFITIITLIFLVIIYSININNWGIELIKDIFVGIFSGTIVSCVISYFILKKSINLNHKKYCFALNELLEVYEYLLKIDELPFGIDDSKCITLIKSVDDVVSKLEYETIFKKNIEPYQCISVKTLYLRTALEGGQYDFIKLQEHYIEILHIINDLSKNPNCFEMEMIKNNCEKKLNKIHIYIK